MRDQETEVKDVLILNERVFWICDAWPLNNSYRKFVMYMSYLSVHMVIMYMDLYDVMGNLELMVENIIDNTIATTTYLMLYLLRFSKLIKNVVAMVKRELAENDFRNNDEKQLYLSYNIISDNFGKYAVRTTAVIAVMWYITPMLELLQGSESDNSTYRLPFRIHSFLDYEDNLKNYMLMYAYQMPLMFIALLHISSISLLLSLVLHVCGKFSILSYRIQNIAEDSKNSFQRRVKELVERHVELIMTANTLNSALQYILAMELIQTSIRMAVLMYTILLLKQWWRTYDVHKIWHLNDVHYRWYFLIRLQIIQLSLLLQYVQSDDIVDIFTYGLYVTIVTLMLYLYSYIGERLQIESKKVNDAYYDANWLKLSIYDQKLLLYCMCNGRKTLNLKAGKFYSFSLFGFIQIMKTCFGYVSLLRALI